MANQKSAELTYRLPITIYGAGQIGMPGAHYIAVTRELDVARAILKSVFAVSREGCFSRKRSERDRALSEINRMTEKFQ